MKATVRRSLLRGSLQASPSKSYTHRAMFCAALAQGESKLQSPLSCDDTLATSECLSKVGVKTEWEGGSVAVTGRGELEKPSDVIFCRESGTTLRFMTAICATIPYESEISGAASLLRRPVKHLALALQELGANCACQGGYPPVHVRGPMKGGTVTIPGNVSSQYVSALLLAAPFAEAPVEIGISGRSESRPYLQMTLNMQSRFGVRVIATDDLSSFQVRGGKYRPCNVAIEGDWSSVSCLLAAAAVAGDEIHVFGLEKETLQPDRCLLEILQHMNGRVGQDSDSVTVASSTLEPVDIDVSDCPDLFPAICALSAAADGTSRITGIRRLRIKESNRVLAMSEGLREMGIKTVESENSLIVHGGKPQKTVLNPHRDHRIAMAFAALGLCTDEVTILDADCVGKSYPSFWSDLRSLGAEVMLH